MMRVPLLIAIAASVAAVTAPGSARVQQPQVVGYVFAQDTELQPGQIEAKNLTTINYAFANISNGRMVTGFAHDQQNYAYLDGLRLQNPRLKVMVSVGGWLWSTNFSDVALTHISREIFIQSVMEFLQKYDLDGLDIDWEYPGMPGAGHPYRSEDKQNFTMLLSELRHRFDEQAVKTHRHLLLTIAAGGSDEFIAHTEMDKVEHYLDTVNLMAYDYYEPESDHNTGNHSPLFTDPADPKAVSSDKSVKAFEKAGVRASKIVLGVPFYGHTWGQVPDHNHGLFEPGKPIPNAYSSYSMIQQTMLNQGFTRYWDAAASVPYLYSSAKQVFVSYEDAESLASKSKYVREQGLGGVMFWDYSGDPSGTLLNAIHDGLSAARTSGASK